MVAKGVEEIAFIPVELQRTMRAAIEVRMHLAIETNGESGNRFTAPRYFEAHTATALYEFAAVTDDTPPMRCSHS
jgi:hypothetical protein